MGIIFALSAQSTLPHAPDDLLDVILKKSAHAAGYAVLAMLLCRALGIAAAVHAEQATRLRTAIALGIALAYAISDEYHQSFVAGRTPSPVDVMIDFAGALLGAAAYHWYARAATAQHKP
jgi:VanZ family protein